MADRRVWRVNAFFPSLASAHANQRIRITGRNWKQAMREAIRQLAKLPVVKGRKVRDVTVHITMEENGYV